MKFPWEKYCFSYLASKFLHLFRSQYSQFWRNKITTMETEKVRTMKNDDAVNSMMKVNAPENPGPEIELGSGYSRAPGVKIMKRAYRISDEGK